MAKPLHEFTRTLRQRPSITRTTNRLAVAMRIAQIFITEGESFKYWVKNGRHHFREENGDS